jgi:hypothetical protein
MSVEDFRRYVDGINNDPDVKAAYQEFAAMYKDMGLE